MTSSNIVSVALLTDEQVVEQYFQYEAGMADVQKASATIREQWAAAMKQEPMATDLTDREKELMLQAALRISESAMIELKSQVDALALHGFAVEDMRTVLRFREEYPEIHAKSKELNAQLVPIFGQWMQKLIKDLEASMDEVSEAIEREEREERFASFRPRLGEFVTSDEEKDSVSISSPAQVDSSL